MTLVINTCYHNYICIYNTYSSSSLVNIEIVAFYTFMSFSVSHMSVTHWLLKQKCLHFVPPIVPLNQAAIKDDIKLTINTVFLKCNFGTNSEK